MSPRSALPDFYYFVFAAYEPLLCILGFLGTLAYVVFLVIPQQNVSLILIAAIPRA